MNLDPLTQLPTHAAFVEMARRALANPGPDQTFTSILSISLDDFHRVNETYGLAIGDEVLVLTADRLRKVAEQGPAVGDVVVARFGGDQFLILCSQSCDEECAAVIANKVTAAIEAPIELGQRQLLLTATIGIAFSAGTSDPERLLIDADLARRHAKQLGGARQEFYVAQHRESAVATADLIEALQHALAADEFRLVYQPKISLATGQIVGVEALVRWEHPSKGLIMPGEFIPAAELSGLVVQIGEWVIRESCRQSACWNQAYPTRPIHVAINVSARQFRSELVKTILDATTEFGASANMLWLEMTESTIMDDIDHTVDLLDHLKRAGFHISIDDFGTGYSSLEYLYRLPIEEVKIDRSFVAAFGDDKANNAIVATIISMGHAMDLQVIAEGVETSAQLERLRTLGCDLAQGYFIAPPVSAGVIDGYLATDSTGKTLVENANADGGIAPPDTQTVLIVDDAEDVRMLASMSLSAAGFAVSLAESGAAAIALARRLRPDCVLLDVNMPEMTGFEVCRSLRSDQDTAECAIVMLTSLDSAADKAEAFLRGADDYVVKPFTPRDLAARVRSAVSRRQAATRRVGREIDSVLLDMFASARDPIADQATLSDGDRFTSRQIEILRRMLAGERVPQIARELFVSQSTVRNHLSAIYQKQGVHSQEELLRLLRQRNNSTPPG